MKYKNIKAIFFDIGGVLLSNGWDTASRKKAANQFKLDFDEMNQLHQNHFPIFELGDYSLAEYLDKVIFYKQRNFSKIAFIDFMFAQSIELPNTLAWLKEWKKECKIPIFTLNNEAKELNDYRINHFQLHSVFDGFISSAIVGMRKPNPKMYHLALAIAHVNPEESIYFDDRAYLVNAARHLGIQAVEHKDFENTKAILISINQ